MTRDEAKRILSLYRPWADANDPDFAEALALARADAELARWFEQHCATQSAIRSSLKQIAPPPGLKEQVISERRARVMVRRRRNVLLAVGAAVFLALAGWIVHEQSREAPNQFANFRHRMIRTALRGYSMDLETNDLAVVRAYLGGHSAPTNYVIPQALGNSQPTGCAILTWQGRRVSMVCFHSGRPLQPGDKADLFLFVTERGPELRPLDSTKFKQVNQVATATWMENGLIYLLATPGDEDFLKKYL